jgi:hypothetical protein
MGDEQEQRREEAEGREDDLELQDEAEEDVRGGFQPVDSGMYKKK